VVAALSALSLANRGQAGEAGKSLNDAAADLPSDQSRLLRALLFKNAGQDREALDCFIGSQIALSDSSAMKPFQSDEDELRWQVARLYARLNRPRAALKVAAVDERLRGVAVANSGEMALPETRAKFLTLSARTLERQKRSRLELLVLLSLASEQIGEFDKAADFERARITSLSADERRKAEARIEQLKAKQEEKAKKRAVPMTVSEALVASR
jgi:hypothetical protein